MNKTKLISIKNLIRPFTLLYPLVAVVSGCIFAFNLLGLAFNIILMIRIILGAIAAPLLNASSNIINQIYDLEIDKINKPERPLPKGEISTSAAGLLSAFIVIIALIFAYFASFYMFILGFIAYICSMLYSIPPVRLKRFHWVANLFMAIPRGLLLITAGWVIIGPIHSIQPWLIGIILFLFMFGANTTKDYGDMEGDRANGVITIPIKYGTERGTKLIKPFLIFPFFLIIPYCALGWLSWIFAPLCLFAILGYRIIYLIEKTPDKTSIDDNHPSWKLMYLLVSGFTLYIAIISFFVFL